MTKSPPSPAGDTSLIKFGGAAGMLREAMDRLAKQFALHVQRWPESESYAEWLARFVTAATLRTLASQENTHDRT